MLMNVCKIWVCGGGVYICVSVSKYVSLYMGADNASHVANFLFCKHKSHLIPANLEDAVIR